ncbi:DUF2586 family protein [Pseudomaricurvus alkylphenolicus]|uniref:DUF2586 domain-containing protein n=1 Tax=Pseudomaricurvus alkylphenolicus TaxID=1306991 RepID=UPI0014243582|nr:DUF2586 domain-containing protein [Pseudomaricurvus alkylphenolicus]NIB44778.1 DUF2586 family protein [Pseudomaricurvus alkylphenolicus]
MAQGKVTTNNLNLAQGGTPAIERKALFIGVGTKNTSAIMAINGQSDFEDLLGVNDSEIKRNVIAARDNGGENWQCFAAPRLAGYTWEDVVDEAMATVSPEFIVLCTPATDSSDLDAMHTKAESLRTTLGRRVIIATATAGIDAGTQSWADYITAQAAITDSVAAYRVGVVPQLHGNDLGVAIGRLCNDGVSIADSPMRTGTGPVLGLGAVPVDTNGVALDNATLQALDANRLSCVQTYVDYPGVYFSNFYLLDAPGGDYQVVENLRVVDKAARAIRLLQIAKIADRGLNSTPLSIAANQTYFAGPLRDMSKATTFAGQHRPGEIKPPKDGDVTIVWPTTTRVEVYFKLTPYNSPKEIVGNIALDLSGAGQ